MQEYSLADLKRLFGLPPALVRKLSQAGFIAPPKLRGKSQYSFQDLLVLRVAGALKAAKISTPKIAAALEQIRGAIPSGRLPAIALAASGKDLAVREGAREWEASGQYALPLATRLAAGQVAELKRPAALPADLAHELFQRGHGLEDSDVAAARAAYLAALEVRADHLEARINLGRLLHLDGQLEAAEKLYRQAKASSALLSFNLAILLEDLEREDDAVAAYREALAQDPLLCDAHFNLARLHEKANRPREALRHLLAYKRHVARYGE
jgi:tetratricopeptide (TPR) repeat protein